MVANPVKLSKSTELSTKTKALPSTSKVSVANSIRLLRRKNKIKASSDSSNKIVKEKLLIYSCNVRSIGNKKKSVEKILEDNSIDIAILQELNVKNMSYFKGYTQFNYISNRKGVIQTWVCGHLFLLYFSTGRTVPRNSGHCQGTW